MYMVNNNGRLNDYVVGCLLNVNSEPHWETEWLCDRVLNVYDEP